MWDTANVGAAMKTALNAMGIPIPEDWSGIHSFLQDRKGAYVCLGAAAGSDEVDLH